jgi:hypothetical protein
MTKPPGPTRGSPRIAMLNWIGMIAVGLAASITTTASAQEPGLSVDRLLQMNGQELDALYRQGVAAGVPAGRVRGTALLAPGTRRNGTMALGTRLVWQGKVFGPDGASAVNRFFGLQVVRAQVYQDVSWHDGAPSLILDYSNTSRIYARYRDEIRQVAPGLFLGLMYARPTPRPTLRMYFALEVQP